MRLIEGTMTHRGFIGGVSKLEIAEEEIPLGDFSHGDWGVYRGGLPSDQYEDVWKSTNYDPSALD